MSDQKAREAAAKAAYETWIAPVRDLEPAWNDLPEDHRERLIDAQMAAIDAYIAVSLPLPDDAAKIVERLEAKAGKLGSDEPEDSVIMKGTEVFFLRDFIRSLSAQVTSLSERVESERAVVSSQQRQGIDLLLDRSAFELRALAAEAERDRLREALNIAMSRGCLHRLP